MTKEKIIKELRDMVCDVNVEEIQSHEGNSLRQWTLAWGHKMMILLDELEGLEE